MWLLFEDTNLMHVGNYGTMIFQNAHKTENICSGILKWLDFSHQIFGKISFIWNGNFEIVIYKSSSDMAIISTLIVVNILILCIDLPVSAMETESSGSNCIYWDDFIYYLN